MTAHANAVGAVVTALAGLAGGNVRRGWPWPMPEAVDEEIVVRPESSNAEFVSVGSGPVDWRTAVTVQIRKRYTPDSTSPDEAVDALLGQAYAALQTVNGTGIQDVVPGSSIVWDYSGADSNVVAVSITVEVLHRTEAATLTAWA